MGFIKDDRHCQLFVKLDNTVNSDHSLVVLFLQYSHACCDYFDVLSWNHCLKHTYSSGWQSLDNTDEDLRCFSSSSSSIVVVVLLYLSVVVFGAGIGTKIDTFN